MKSCSSLKFGSNKLTSKFSTGLDVFLHRHQIINKLKKMSSKSYIIRELQIKSTLKRRCIPFRTAKLQQNDTNCWRVRNYRNSHSSLVDYTATLEDSLAVSPKAKLFTLESNNCVSSVYATALKNDVQIKTSMRLCTAVLFVMAKTIKKLGYPLVDECLSKWGYIQKKGSRTCHSKIRFFGMRIVLS